MEKATVDLIKLYTINAANGGISSFVEHTPSDC